MIGDDRLQLGKRVRSFQRHVVVLPESEHWTSQPQENLASRGSDQLPGKKQLLRWCSFTQNVRLQKVLTIIYFRVSESANGKSCILLAYIDTIHTDIYKYTHI